MEIPLFPLSSIVLPEGLLPLRIFESRYIEMIKQCFRDDSGFGVCLIKEGTEVGKPAEPHLLGTLVKIGDWDQGPDGLLQITVQGVQGFRLQSWLANSNDLLIGEVELLTPEPPLPLKPQHQPLARRLRELLTRMEHTLYYPNPRFDEAGWVCHRLIEILPLSPLDKLTLLQMQCHSDRLNILEQYMFSRREAGMADISKGN